MQAIASKVVERNWSPVLTALGPGGATVESCIVYLPSKDRSLAVLDRERRNVDIFDFFLPKVRHWWWAQASDLADKIFRGGALPRLAFSRVQFESAVSALSVGSSDKVNFLAALVGTPGPYQKVALLGMSEGGEVRVVKLALGSSADMKIRAESQVLQRIQSAESTVLFTPKILGYGEVPSGRPFFTMRGIVGSPSSRRMSRNHVSLLKLLSSKTEVGWQKWESTRMHTRVHERVAELSLRGLNSYAIIVQSLNVIDDFLMGELLQPCLSHGDFAPWNIVETQHGPVLLDWEYAVVDGNPLADYCHFNLIQEVLNRSESKKARKLLAELVKSAPELFPYQFSRCGNMEKLAGGLVLLYLLETVCLYILSSPSGDGSDRVTSSFIFLMADFFNWGKS